ncbi:MarR family winged helix-turn-helix transcriptional regulator [Piscinibacter koreensis]|uniref:Winged helix-turn-helix transcriptional regulator n=1 Tax=Piscinibacter koreensis TaxID=2742824 RepID=A0A7Y6NL66_9BURK|nr:MarR family winged helix-turn-helix transcriptional regulator [Schlegelella koreensis]NUZ05248.1 winged helix-turn-helix transcriptional regulator [Schlegelella koreensis]
MPRIAAPDPAARPQGCTNLKLRQLTRRVSRQYDAAVAVAGLKTTQYSLLSAIVAREPIAPGRLARLLEMDASTLTRNLQPLIGAGWVEVGAGGDARSRVVTATSSGRAKRAAAQAEWKRAQLALNRQLGDERVVRLHALLDECLRIVNAAPGDSDEPESP